VLVDEPTSRIKTKSRTESLNIGRKMLGISSGFNILINCLQYLIVMLVYSILLLLINVLVCYLLVFILLFIDYTF
jgi:hypothetical protein